MVKLACSQAPGEHTGWTSNLLSNKLVELDVVTSISRETVRRTLKKRPQAVAKAAMVHRAGARCRLCGPDGASAGRVLPAGRGTPSGHLQMDEQPKQLIDQVRMPTPASRARRPGKMSSMFGTACAWCECLSSRWQDGVPHR
ncbi:hypothetical protein [Noviherbaspirillum soli]|uniref:hypothetical protein n=1 Tax=Noviherbaspirillum soli TaxID=1064518 RepID=UPI00188CF616|nr:hypothetical protein [Noviherbaspirillum soli]